MFRALWNLAILALIVGLKKCGTFEAPSQASTRSLPKCQRPSQFLEYGAEDIEVVESLDIAFVSSGIHYFKDRASGIRGKIFLIDLNVPFENLKAEELKIAGTFNRDEFRPHGISSYYDHGRLELYVINHNLKFEHSIIVFEYDQKEHLLNYRRTITDSAFRSIVYYNGKKSQIVLDNLLTPNGIAIDKSKKHLFVSSPNARSTTVYSLIRVSHKKTFWIMASLFKVVQNIQNKESKISLTEISKVPLYTSPDNLYLDKQNSLWIGCHPVAYKVFLQTLFSGDERFVGPSQVLHVEFRNQFKEWSVKEVYSDDGSEIPASSVAVTSSDKILIGSINHNLIVCKNLYF
ncbi:unnamed protein product [Enterobius vermicularis]|uniref:Arylesterase n=1 Tax=Enterobius vermicularis TaxID=51028 RepID=A0A0N4UWL4_ENTVE|nr:unnamed protein product [Enterobius vermicularis]